MRNLERQLATLYRKIAKKIVEAKETDPKSFAVSSKDLHGYLGPYKFASSLAETKMRSACLPGLPGQKREGHSFIEVALMPGREPDSTVSSET